MFFLDPETIDLASLSVAVTSWAFDWRFSCHDDENYALYDHCREALHRCCTEPATVYIALKYMKRYTESIALPNTAVTDVFSACLRLAIKYHLDPPFFDLPSSPSIKALEHEYLQLTMYSLHVDVGEFLEWVQHCQLVCLAYEAARRATTPPLPAVTSPLLPIVTPPPPTPPLSFTTTSPLVPVKLEPSFAEALPSCLSSSVPNAVLLSGARAATLSPHLLHPQSTFVLPSFRARAASENPRLPLQLSFPGVEASAFSTSPSPPRAPSSLVSPGADIFNDFAWISTLSSEQQVSVLNSWGPPPDD